MAYTHSMVDNLRDMAGKISTATATIASSSEELSATAAELEKNSALQCGHIRHTIAMTGRLSDKTMDTAGSVCCRWR
jgi:methyl-accepting chemotaxis protein